MMTSINLFLSTVSAEFRSYRDALRHDLTRPNVTVKVQEDFIVTGTEILDMLDDYIRQCDAVIHLVGDMTGALAQAPSLAWIQSRYPDLAQRLPPLSPCLQPGVPALSYTQWEAWLALYHRKRLIIACPEPNTPRDASYQMIDEQRVQQRQHLERLAAYERYPLRFSSADRLVAEIWRSKLLDLLVHADSIQKSINPPPPKPIILPLASLGTLFKGRDALLEELQQSLSKAPSAADTPAVVRVLKGLGGGGKTRLALEYARQHVDDYSALLFIVGDSAEALQRNLAALCGLLNLPARQEVDESKQCAAALAWLRQYPGWLLIIDNVDSESAALAVETLAPQLLGGHVLVTTRLAHWSHHLQPLLVDVLSSEAAVQFLLERTQTERRLLPNDASEAATLVDELGNLALALEQAGAYICQRRLTFEGYFQQWYRRRDAVLSWYDARQMHYPNSVAVTWQTSFDQLSTPALQLLQCLAWLSPAPVPETLLEVPLADNDNAIDWFAALAELESYSLVSRGDNPSFTVHRLVQEVTRRQQSDLENVHLSEALFWLDTAFSGDPQDVRNWPQLNPLLPHAQAVAEYADLVGITTPTARLFNQLGLMYLTKSLYGKAEPLMRRTLEINEKSYGADHSIVARDLNNLVGLLQATNRLSEAGPLMRRALEIDEKSFGANHPTVATELNNLAQLLQATNRLSEAEPLMCRALEIDEKSFGADHPNVARDLNNLTGLFQATNRLREAEPLIRRALEIDEKNFGADHPNVAIRLNNLAQMLQAINRLREAEPLMRRALEIDEKSFGADHPTVATDLNNLAQLLQATNRLSEAEPLMHRAWEIDEKSYGVDHPSIARDLNNLAGLFQATNRLREAEPLIRRALEIDEKSFGADHPSVAIRLNNLAGLLKEANRLREAEPLMRRALKIDEKSFGADHPNVAIDLNNLAQLLKATNHLSEAEPLLRRAMIVAINSLGIQHPDSDTVLNNYIALLHDLGKTESEIKAQLHELTQRLQQNGSS